MQFSLNTLAFARAVQSVYAAVPSSPLVPSIANVMLVGRGTPAGSGGTLHMATTNLEVRLVTSIPFEGAENFAVLVDAKRLLETLRGFPDAALTVTIDDDTTRPGVGIPVELKVGKSRYKLVGEDPEGFPKGKKLDANHRTIAIPANLLHEALRATLAVSMVALDVARPFTNGIYMETTNHFLAFVAYGDNRLCAHTLHADTEQGDACTWEEAGAALISRSSANLLYGMLDAKSAEAVTLQFDATTVRLADNRWVATLMDHAFVPWQDIVTKAVFAQRLDIDRDELVTALKRLTGYAPELTQLVRFDVQAGGHLLLEADDPRYGNEGTEALVGELVGEPLTIGFPCKRLLELLGLFPAGPVRLSFVEGASGVMLTNPADDELPTLTCVITAMRLVEVAA